MRLFQVKVTNTSDELIGRGGYTFSPKSTKEVSVTEYGYLEIGAHHKLKCVKVTKEQAPEIPQEEEKVSQEEVVEEVPVEEDGEEFPCPHCDYVGKSKSGLRKHLKKQHSSGE